jgi:hypothetical protein
MMTSVVAAFVDPVAHGLSIVLSCYVFEECTNLNSHLVMYMMHVVMRKVTRSIDTSPGNLSPQERMTIEAIVAAR